MADHSHPPTSKKVMVAVGGQGIDAETVRSRDGSRYAQRYEQWQQKAKWPGLVAGVLFALPKAKII